jgi:hypothetical protein
VSAAFRLDLAILPDRLLARLPDGSERGVPLDPPLEPGSDPDPVLRGALDRLARHFEGSGPAEGGEDPEGGEDRTPPAGPPPGTRVRVALLPPLVQARFVALPPLSGDEARQVLRRDASRHFLGGGRAPMTVAVLPHYRGTNGGGSGRLAAAVPEALAQALARVVEARGWRIEGLFPAHAGWIAHARETGSDRVHASSAEGGVHTVRLVDGYPVEVRRHRDAPAPGGMELDRMGVVEAALGPPGHALDRRFSFVPPLVAALEEHHDRRRALRLAGAAAVLLLLAATVHGWSVSAELRGVQADRRALADRVAPALVLRDSIDRMEERLHSLRTVETRAARWSFPLLEISMVLPHETHLVGLRIVGDTVALEGVGGRAGDALASLSETTSLSGVRVEGPIQRTLVPSPASGEASGVEERFTLSALLSRPGGGP